MEHAFALEVAEAEEQALQESARTRVINIIQSKKRAIQKEKDLLDTADSNALLYTSSGFTTTQPGSPGGSHNNRKTRNMRHHRPDPESAAEPADGGNKRKRKLPGDFDHESPAPPLRALGDPPPAERDSPEPIEAYFSAKDLAAHARAASTAVAQVWAERPPGVAPHGDAPNGTGAAPPDAPADADARRGRRRTPDEPDAPDATALLAPAMERSGSYATRSTRYLNAEPTVPARSALANDGGGGGGGGGGGDPRQVFGAAVLDAHAARAKVTSTKDVEAPLSSGLSAAELAEDMQLLARLMTDPAP